MIEVAAWLTVVTLLLFQTSRAFIWRRIAKAAQRHNRELQDHHAGFRQQVDELRQTLARQQAFYQRYGMTPDRPRCDEWAEVIEEKE
jgi:hypothetical protein